MRQPYRAICHVARRSVPFAPVQKPLRPRVRQVREKTKPRTVRSKRSETIWIPRKHRNPIVFRWLPSPIGRGRFGEKTGAKRAHRAQRDLGIPMGNLGDPPALLRSLSSGTRCVGARGIGENHEGTDRTSVRVSHSRSIGCCVCRRTVRLFKDRRERLAEKH